MSMNTKKRTKAFAVLTACTLVFWSTGCGKSETTNTDSDLKMSIFFSHNMQTHLDHETTVDYVAITTATTSIQEIIATTAISTVSTSTITVPKTTIIATTTSSNVSNNNTTFVEGIFETTTVETTTSTQTNEFTITDELTATKTEENPELNSELECNITEEIQPEVSDDELENSEDEEVSEEDIVVYSVSDGDYIRLCNAVAHEAGSDGISTEDKAKVVEVILNRTLSWNYPDTILEVLVQPNQFTGAESYAYLSEFTYKVTPDVERAVNGYLQGEYVNHGYFSFYGDGYQNHFS